MTTLERPGWTRRRLLQTAAVASLGLCLSLTSTLACEAGPGGKGGKGPGKGRGGKGRGGPGQAPLAVELAALEAATIERVYRASGTLEALRRAQIKPLRTGIIEALDVEVGDTVEEGQILARLDGRELSLQARRDKLTAGNARRELARLEGLDRAGVVASEEVDARRFELESANAAARLSRTQAATMTVRAPFAGTIVARDVDVGNLASTATTLYEVADLSVVELPLHLPEREAAKVAVDTEVEIELVDGSRFMAVVVRRAPIVDALTGTVEFLVRASEFPPLAVPGAYVRAEVLLERHSDVPSLPVSAVFELEGQRYAYLLREGKARRVAVELGLEGPERIEILTGIDPVDQVLRDAKGITEGMPVKVAGEPDPTEAETEGAGVDSGGRRGGH